MTAPSRRAALIVNTHSRRGQAMFRAACAALKHAPFPVDARAVRDPAKLDATIENVLAARPDLVILGGGDGTISGLVDRLVGRGVTLGVLPLGTANSFARSLGIPLDLAGAVRVLTEGAPRRIDLGMIDDDYFANAATLGIAPQIAESVPSRLKKLFGRAGYLSWAAIQFLTFRPFHVTVDDGTGARTHKVVEVRIANGRFHGGTEVMEGAEVDSGEIVVELVRGHVKRRLASHWAATLLRLPSRRDDVVTVCGREVRISTDRPMPVSIDGDVLARTPCTARIAPGVIEVMAPRGG